MALLLLASPVVSHAGEEDDLQRQIESQRSGVIDLERLDDSHATTEEITLLRAWLDEAWSLRAKHEYDVVREVLDRCLAQADLIRQKIASAKLRAQVQKREESLQALRTRIQQTRKAIQDMTVKKKTLEGNVK
jgi:Zn-dependent peptidase ImmA (M78 family)